MAPSSLGKQTADFESPHDWLMSLSLDLATLYGIYGGKNGTNGSNLVVIIIFIIYQACGLHNQVLT